MTGRDQYFDLPMGCPRPPISGDFFNAPVLIPKDTVSPIQFLKAFAGIFSPEDRLSREELTDLKDSIYDERLLTPNDLLGNTVGQTKLATAMGVLEEGELFENFLRRDDMHVVGIDDSRSYQNMIDGIPQAVVGMLSGIKGFGRKQGEIYFGGLPTSCSAPTKYPGIRISIHFIANRGSIMEEGDRHIPLDSLVAHGRATPKMSLYIPTDYLVPLKTS